MSGQRVLFLHVIWNEDFNAERQIQVTSFCKMRSTVIKTPLHRPFYRDRSPNDLTLWWKLSFSNNLRALKKCSERGSNGPRLRIHYGNYGRTRSNRNCYPLGLTDIDCISPRASRFIENSCSVKGSILTNRLRNRYSVESYKRKTSLSTWYSDTVE